MTKPQWHFRRFEAGDNLSDPDFTKALFASDSDSAIARSLIRESIQNSLDARRDDVQQVRVRIAIHRGAEAVDPLHARPFTADLAPHLYSADAGLSDPPSASQPIPFLVLEDFGTHGLRGDPEHWRPIDIGKNAFFLFFRALGRSGKADENRGRWGVGKFVFPMSSTGHAIWGLTIPSDTNKPLLMGRAVLRTHSADGEQWHPDGHWGTRTEGGSKFVSPCNDQTLLDQFRALFRVTRVLEPGLTVVVPWLSEEIKLPGLRNAILGEYFLPVLRGQLIVELADGESCECIDAAAVRSFTASSTDRVLKERLALAVAIVDGAGFQFEWPERLNWDSLTIRREAISDHLRDMLRASLDAGKELSITIPVTVGTKKPPTPRESELVVHLRRADGLGGLRPLIVRDGITVSLDKTKQVFDHVALVVAEGGALASAIGDAETPAHEQLQHDLLKDRYKYPRKLIAFVREAAAALVRAIRHAETEDDPLTLATYFPVEASAGPRRPAPAPKKKGEQVDERVPDIPPARPRKYRVSQIENGFRVVGNTEGDTFPSELRIAVAYDVQRGNPILRYHKLDFDVGGSGITRAGAGCVIAASAGNHILVRPSRPDFTLEVHGFDPERDLVVRVTASEAEE